MNEAQSEYLHFMIGKLTAFCFVLVIGLAVSLILKGKREDNKFVWWPTIVAIVLILMSLFGSMLSAATSASHGQMFVEVLDEGPQSEPLNIYSQQQLVQYEQNITQYVIKERKAKGFDDKKNAVIVSTRNFETENGNTIRSDIKIDGVLEVIEVSGVAGGRAITIGCQMGGAVLVYDGTDCSKKVEMTFGVPKSVKRSAE